MCNNRIKWRHCKLQRKKCLHYWSQAVCMNRMSYRANDSIPSIPPPSYHPLEVLGSPLTNNSGGGHNLHQINNESWEQLKKVRIRNFISLFCVLLFVACKSLLSSSSFLDWEKACLSVPFLHASNHGPQILWLYTDQIISFLQLRHSRKRLYLGLQKWHLSRIWRKFEAILLGRVVL